mmetsp:Transcript_12248/g.49174  ORF Transcript_12248/g.49174 Transcript_12248/m.49174 type:complete len:263 (+) Transcript_12248:451-1239(+)
MLSSLPVDVVRLLQALGSVVRVEMRHDHVEGALEHVGLHAVEVVVVVLLVRVVECVRIAAGWDACEVVLRHCLVEPLVGNVQHAVVEALLPRPYQREGDRAREAQVVLGVCHEDCAVLVAPLQRLLAQCVGRPMVQLLQGQRVELLLCQVCDDCLEPLWLPPAPFTHVQRAHPQAQLLSRALLSFSLLSLVQRLPAVVFISAVSYEPIPVVHGLCLSLAAALLHPLRMLLILALAHKLELVDGVQRLRPAQLQRRGPIEGRH